MSKVPDDYRPKSPDLSAFAPPPLPPQRKPSIRQEPSFPNNYPFARHRGSYDASPYFSPAVTTPSQSYFGLQRQAETPGLEPFTPRGLTQPPPVAPQFQQPNYFQTPPTNPDYTANIAPTLAMPRPRRRKSAGSDDSEDQSFAPGGQSSRGGTRGTKKRRSNGDAVTAGAADLAVPPGPTSFQGIDVRTKFPVARIKRIMQDDEEVGKVAQATPTAVSKALELFMIQLVQKGVSEARSKGGKKVSAAHLKNAIVADKQFDFLGEICEKVSDQQPGAKGEGDSDDGGDTKSEAGGAVAGTGSARKKGKVGKGKKKGGDDGMSD